MDETHRFLLRRTEILIESVSVNAHVSHLVLLETAGDCVCCDSFKDGTGGVVVLRASSLAESESRH